jgi:hypothetical protein
MHIRQVSGGLMFMRDSNLNELHFSMLGISVH